MPSCLRGGVPTSHVTGDRLDQRRNRGRGGLDGDRQAERYACTSPRTFTGTSRRVRRGDDDRGASLPRVYGWTSPKSLLPVQFARRVGAVFRSVGAASCIACPDDCARGSRHTSCHDLLDAVRPNAPESTSGVRRTGVHVTGRAIPPQLRPSVGEGRESDRDHRPALSRPAAYRGESPGHGGRRPLHGEGDPRSKTLVMRSGTRI